MERQEKGTAGEWWLSYGDVIRTISAKSTCITSILATCFCSPALASESGAALSSAVRDLSAVLANVVIAALVIAVIVYCSIELVKLPLRLYFNYFVFLSWKKTRRSYHAYLHHRMGTQLFLSSDLFIKRLENRARAAMEGAHDSVELYFFAAGAPETDIESVLNALRDREPFDDRLAAAQANVAAAIERNLDELQITMTFWWPRVVQATAIVISLIIVLRFSSKVGGLGGAPLLLILIAVAGAYLASIFRDIVGILRRLGGR